MRCSVLIVDDHTGFRSSARMLLTTSGYDVIGEACDGESAVRAAGDLRPELVLLDVQLPDNTGFEVAHRLCEGPDPPTVVLVSSRDASDYGSRISRSGARGFIPKDELSGETLDALLTGRPR
jgi:DNA-binding NarL/FixJ family response regulator